MVVNADGLVVTFLVGDEFMRSGVEVYLTPLENASFFLFL